MDATTTAPSTAKTTAVKALAYGMFVVGLAMSVYHIGTAFYLLGSGLLAACVAPLFVDGIQIIGKLARGTEFAAGTRRLGFRVQMAGATLSLIANVGFAHAWGQRLTGALFVGGYMFAEWFAEHLRPVSDDVQRAQAEAEAAAKAKRTAAAAQAAATRKANREQAEIAKAKAGAARAARKAQAAKARKEVVALVLADDTRAYL